MSGPTHASLRVPLCALALGLAVSFTSFVAGRRELVAAEIEASRLRELRAELHELQRAGVRLASAAHVPVPDASLDGVRIAILDAVRELDAGARVRVLRYRLLDGEHERGDGSGMRAVRLVVELRAAHAVRLVRALDALRATTPAWPVEVAGCRVDRAGADDVLSGSSSAAEGDHALIAACALDWFWWPA